MFVGMMFGAMFWGTLSDVYGRKQAFNFTLIVTTVFGIGASFANSYWLLCLLILGLGFGVSASFAFFFWTLEERQTRGAARKIGAFTAEVFWCCV